MQELLEVMARLRSENGCPWDRAQTHESLKRYAIEETYEVLSAIDRNDMSELCDELGDLLFQVVFHAQIAKENGFFDFQDVVNGCVSKMVRRHPHVFADAKQVDAGDWERLKQAERKKGQGLMSDLPPALPSLMKAEKTIARASRVGFPVQETAKPFEALQTYKKADNPEEKEEALGTLLFEILSSAKGLNAEQALSNKVAQICHSFDNAGCDDTLFYDKFDDETKKVFWNSSKFGKSS